MWPSKMQYLSSYSHTEKQMILGNPNVIMRLERMLQAQQEFADAVSHASRDLRDTQEQNYYGTPVHQKGGGRVRTPAPTLEPKKRTSKKFQQIEGTPLLSRGSGIVYNDY